MIIINKIITSIPDDIFLPHTAVNPRTHVFTPYLWEQDRYVRFAAK